MLAPVTALLAAEPAMLAEAVHTRSPVVVQVASTAAVVVVASTAAAVGAASTAAVVVDTGKS
jgi:hypothetical protein